MSAGDGGARALVERYAQSCPVLYDIRLHPESAGDLYSDLGSKLSAIGNRRAAANAYYHAISLVPTHAVAYNNLAALLLGSSRRSEALDFFLTAHALQPEQYTRYPQMHLNLAGSLVDAGRYSEAIWHYGRGLAYPPNEEDTLGRILHLSQRVCDWRAVDRFWSRAYQALVTRTVRVGHRRASGERPALSPMHALTLPLSAQELFALSVAHASAIEADVAARRFGYRHPLVPLPLQPAAEEDRLATSVEVAARGEGRATRDRGGGLVRQRARLHVGWISADFKRHPVTILLAPALAAMRASCVDLRLSAFPLNPIGVEPAGAWADASAQSGRGAVALRARLVTHQPRVAGGAVALRARLVEKPTAALLWRRRRGRGRPGYSAPCTPPILWSTSQTSPQPSRSMPRPLTSWSIFMGSSLAALAPISWRHVRRRSRRRTSGTEPPPALVSSITSLPTDTRCPHRMSTRPLSASASRCCRRRTCPAVTPPCIHSCARKVAAIPAAPNAHLRVVLGTAVAVTKAVAVAACDGRAASSTAATAHDDVTGFPPPRAGAAVAWCMPTWASTSRWMS